jgi:hypothetical protein
MITWWAWQAGRMVILERLMFRAQDGKPTALSVWFMAGLLWKLVVFVLIVVLLYRCIT